jgi:hypothetical protein
MFRYSKIYRISPLNGNNEIRDGYDENIIDDIIAKELNKEITIDDYENSNAAIVEDSIYIRDDGRKANRIFNLMNQYYRVVLEEVSNDIIMDNNYIESSKNEEPKDPSLYNMDLWKRFNEFPKEMVKQFRLDITTTDDVLDKINEKGIDYIDDIDKEILKKEI